MTRVLHTGDTHLGYQQYHLPARREDFLAAFQQVADDAVADDVDAVVHAGDLFDDRQPALTDILGAMGVLRTLEEAGIPFLAIVGNHEAKRDRQWLDLFEEMGLATRLGREPVVFDDVAIYGLDFVPRSQRDDADLTFEPAETAQTALVAHGLFEPFEHGEWDAREILREASVAFDALLLGDDHTPRRKRLEDPHEAWLTYPGSTERASASERDERGYNLVTFDGEAIDIRRRGIDTREFVFVDVDLDSGEGTSRVRERVGQYDVDDAVVIVTLTGEGESVTPAEIESYADERGALVTRVNDRRESEDEEHTTDVTFADPDRAVRERIESLGLSSAARDIDETIRASGVADSNVDKVVEDRVADLADDSDPAVFESAGASEGEERADDEATDDERDGEHDETGATESTAGGDSQVTMGDYS
jgi:DNA repair exonuclease SbcCD nuclease subunit